MPETMNTVRFCDTCGTRTSHEGDKCLVCIQPQSEPSEKDSEKPLAPDAPVL